MWNFLKMLLAVILGICISVVLAIVVTVGFVAAISAGDDALETGQVLHLKLNRPVKEIAFDNPFSGLGGGLLGDEANYSLHELKQAIAKAADDAAIEGIFLEAGNLQAGYASLYELQQALIKFKKSGKWVVAYGRGYNEAGMHLAAVADHRYLHPEGYIEYNGIAVNISFYKNLFDKLGIEPQVFRAGTFKAAVEPFLRSDMSAENREQVSAYTATIQQELQQNLSELLE